MSRASRHRILAAMLSACLLSLLGGCTPLTVLAVLAAARTRLQRIVGRRHGKRHDRRGA